MLQKWDAKISASYCLTKCRFNDALMTDLQMLKFFKDIGRERPIFTVDVTKGLMNPWSTRNRMLMTQIFMGLIGVLTAQKFLNFLFLFSVSLNIPNIPPILCYFR